MDQTSPGPATFPPPPESAAPPETTPSAVPPYQGPQAPAPYGVPAPPPYGMPYGAPYAGQYPQKPGNAFSIAAIVLGAIAFLFFPIVLGPAGLILGAVAKSKGEPKATFAMVLAALGTVGGMVLGFVAFSALNR